MKTGPEAKLKRAAIAALRIVLARRGGKVLRLNAGLMVLGKGTSRRVVQGVEPGTPDLLVMLPKGRTVWIELKAPNGKLTPEQARWHGEACGLDHRTAVCRTVREVLEAIE